MYKRKKCNQNFYKIEINVQETHDSEQIIHKMQEYYTRSNTGIEQTIELKEFIEKYQITLPELEQEDRENMEEEFSHEAIQESLKEAKEGSASDLSGQSITIFKYLINEVPILMNIAINQIAFRPDIL